MKFIKKFKDVNLKDLNLVGGKNASLGEMIQQLGNKGIKIPHGFAITSDAYWFFLEKNNLKEKIKNLLSRIDLKKLDEFVVICHEIRSLIRNAILPEELEKEIKESYQYLEKQYGKLCSVAVRSSATAEDLPHASFAGQQDTFLNIKGEKELIRATLNSFASLFTNRAVSYRIGNNFDHMSIALSIGVQKMVRSDKACSGVMFTLDTETGFKDVVLINSSYGLGENIVKGSVNPDEFYVHKPTLENGFKPILKKRLGRKTIKMIFTEDEKNATKNIDVPKLQRKLFSLNDQEILELAKQAIIIEKHYSEIKSCWSPMDIEWAKDGIDGQLYIVQARPETVFSQKKNENFVQEYVLQEKVNRDKILATGKSVGRKIATGKAKVIKSAKFMDQVKPGDILVTDMTDPDWEPIMRRAAGIITNRGGRTCHAAIVSREIGTPAIVGSNNATEKIKDGQVITMDCSNGEIGYIYDGEFKFKIENIEISKIPKVNVDIMMNVGNPDEAFRLACLPNNGVGLARLEFIINSSIQIHPMALIDATKIKDENILKTIEDITIGYEEKKQFFIDKLAQEAGTIAAAFYPKPVIIRMSDFKSNEYSELIAGKYFEPVEENPMIGFRGASRYYNKMYLPAFELECLAMKKIRDEMGLDNVKLMIPFVRTVEEANKVIDQMQKYGLIQRKNNLEIYMMCEVPSNVLLIDDFSKIFDGFSIGSNDLTQLTLAVDRDSSLIADLFDERDKAVKIFLKMAIDGAKRNNKKIGICGQAPSDYPELAEFLVKCGIDSMSLNPDTVLKEFLLLGKR
ncbi:MAG: phosphoenolpyruvate synthase [Candidatus Babeliales bacterium]